MKKINLTGGIFIALFAVVILGLTIPSVGAQTYVQYNNGTAGFSAFTNPAVDISGTSATLTGSVYLDGYATTVYFQYGYTTAFGSETAAQNIGLSPSYAVTINNLSPNTTYYYRLIAVNAGTTYYGAVSNLTTSSYYNYYTAPVYASSYYGNSNYYNNNYVASTAVSGVGSVSETISGSGSPNGYDTLAWFEYGTTPSFGYVTPTQNVGAGYSTVNVSATVNNLLPGTVYYYRIDSENNFGTNYGTTLTFVSPASSVNTSSVVTSNSNNTAVASILTSMDKILLSMESNSNYNSNANQTSQSPSVAVASATSPTVSETVTGTVSPNGSDTTAWFEYGQTTSLGYKTTAQDMGSGTGAVSISATLTGLTPNTTYYYRVAGSNANGSGGGAIHSFTTGSGAANTNTQSSSNNYTASIFSALGGSWTIIGLIILVLVGIGVVVFLRFVLK